MFNFRKLFSFLALAIFTAPVLATAPPIWVNPITNGHMFLFGNGQGAQNANQALAFNFRFDGTNYTSITIGTHGGIALANGETIATDTWSNTAFESTFSAEGTPRILALGSELNHFNDTTGQAEGVYFADNGSRAIITWYRIAGGGDTGNAIMSAQIQIKSNGTIILGYNVEGGGNLATAFSNGLVAGVSDGSGDWPSGSVDLSGVNANDIFGSTTIYQIWCKAGSVANCFQQNGTATENNFDLDGRNVVFNPYSGGFQVSSVEKNGTDPGECAVANSGGGGNVAVAASGGGGGTLGMGLFVFVVLGFLKIVRKNLKFTLFG